MKYFTTEEFECPCCKQNHIKPELVDKLDMARSLAGVPFHVNSGWRCPAHNLQVGGSLTSSHLKGLAADIQALTDFYRFRVVMGAVLAGFTRIGVYKTFIHIDGDPEKTGDRLFLGDIK